MADQYFVGRGSERSGPFSAAQLREFAASGRLRSTDTIWKEGMEKPVLAARAKNLFPAPQPQAHPAGASAPAENGASSFPPPAGGHRPSSPAPAVPPGSSPAPSTVPGTPAEPGVEVTTVATAPAPPASPPLLSDPDPTSTDRASVNASPTDREPEPARKRRAVGVKGAVILSQDGLSVHYRKKCFQCGHEDTCRSTMPIGSGISRTHFYCPKCRKIRDVQIQGLIQ